MPVNLAVLAPVIAAGAIQSTTPPERTWIYDLGVNATHTLRSDGDSKDFAFRTLEYGATVKARLFDSTFTAENKKPHLSFEYNFGANGKGLNDKNRNTFKLEIRSPKNDGLIPDIPCDSLYSVNYTDDESAFAAKDFTVGFRLDLPVSFRDVKLTPTLKVGFDIGERFGVTDPNASNGNIFRGMIDGELKYKVSDRVTAKWTPTAYFNTTKVGDRADLFQTYSLTVKLLEAGKPFANGDHSDALDLTLSSGFGRRAPAFNSESRTQLSLTYTHRFGRTSG